MMEMLFRFAFSSNIFVGLFVLRVHNIILWIMFPNTVFSLKTTTTLRGDVTHVAKYF